MYIYKYIYPQQKIDGENRPMCSKAQITGYGLADERVGYDAVIQAIGIEMSGTNGDILVI